MKAIGQDSLKTTRTLKAGGREYRYFSLPDAYKSIGDGSRLPVSLKILLENVLRFEDGTSYKVDDARAIAEWVEDRRLRHARSRSSPPASSCRISPACPPSSTSPPCATASPQLGGSPDQVNPLVPVDLVIDHSVMVDVLRYRRRATARTSRSSSSATASATTSCAGARRAFHNFRVVPPGTGICHQVNCEYLAKTVWTADIDGATYAYPDTLFGTDSHTTMVNGIGVLGWGVGGIEAEAAMLGQPIAMLIPDVIGFRLTGKLPEGSTATDLALTVTQMLRKKGVVGKFVEFFGPGLAELAVANRADHRQHGPRIRRDLRLLPGRCTRRIDYLRETGRDEARVALVEAYAKAQGMWRRPRHAGAGVHRRRSSSTSPRCCPASPARSARRTACC